MPKERIGIVIPIYNSEKYLERTLYSIQTQTYKNIEVILIDDESDDSSVSIMKSFCNHDCRFKLNQIKHSGAANARKQGIILSDSDLIICVDSDDVLEENYIEKLYDSMSEDIVIDNLYCCDINGEKIRAGYLEPGVYNNMDYVLEHMIVYKDGYGLWPSLCGKIMKKNILLSAYDGIIGNIYYGEDRCVFYKYLLLCKSVHVVEIGGYCYTNRECSVTHKVYDDFLNNINNVYILLKQAFKNHRLEKSLLYQLQYMVSDMINHSTINMGFPRNLTYVKYKLNMFVDREEKIILYGAGNVGIDYYKQIRDIEEMHIVSWVDKYVKQIPGTDIMVESIKNIKNKEYDYILVAVLHEEKFKEIREELNAFGIENNYIRWHKPIINKLRYY